MVDRPIIQPPKSLTRSIEEETYFRNLHRILLEMQFNIDSNDNMTYVSKQLESASTTSTRLYSCPVGALGSQISQILASNYTGSAQTITINVINYQGTEATTNQYVTDLSVGANSTLVVSDLTDLILEPGDFINVTASANDSINIRLSAKEI